MRRRAMLLAALVSLPLARGARADGSDDKAAAQALFEEARDLVMRKEFAQACPKFQRSLKLDPGIGTMLWLADCYQNNGQTASAWAEFKEAAASAVLTHDPREALARRRASEIEPQLSRVSIVVPPEANLAGLAIRKDGLLVSGTELGVAIPMDPGIHAIEAVAPGRKSWNSTFTVLAKPGPMNVIVPVLDPAPPGSEPAAAATGTPASNASATTAAPGPEQPASPVRDGSTQRTAALVVGAAGIVGIGIGAFFGLKANSTYGDSNSNGHCLPDNECDDTGKQLRSDAHGYATASTIAFGLGAAALAGGAVLYFTAPRGSSSSTVALHPVFSERGASLLLVHAF